MILVIHSFNKYVSNGENMPGSTLHSALGIQGLFQNTAPPLPLNLLEVTGYSQVQNRAWNCICISLLVIFPYLPALQQHWPLLVPWRCHILWCPRALACAVPSTQNTLPLPSPLPIFFPHLCPGNSYTWNLSLGITSLETTHLLVIFPGHVTILIAPVSPMEYLLVSSMTPGAVSWGQCLCCSHQSPASGIMLDKGQGLHEHLLNEWIVNRIWCIAFQSNAEPNQGVSSGRRQEVAICPSYFLVCSFPWACLHQLLVYSHSCCSSNTFRHPHSHGLTSDLQKPTEVCFKKARFIKTHWNQIDYTLCSQRWRSSIQLRKNKTRSWLWLQSWTPYCQIQT